ncbi:unnamed protein product, partial [Scytosiphon promiscuus]
AGGRGGRGSTSGTAGAGASSACCVKTVDMKGVPKEVKKTSKCDICKRKYGAMVPCAQAHTAPERPCEKWMHPMCAAHVGRHCRILPPEEAKKTPHKSKYAVVCQDHTAVCLRQLASGHWVDFLSLYKLRTDLDRARVLFDCVLRREKRLVDSCIGATPLEGIAAAVLLRRRSASAFASHKVPEHFGTVLANLVGPRNIRPLTEARRAYVKAHPRPELPPPPPRERLLADRQLMDMYHLISQHRVPREEDDPKWESGRIKPDDGKRNLGELFEEAPSVESYPEYHVKVKNIMDLNTIREKVVERKYPGVEGLLSDVALMYSNAQLIKHEQATKDGKQLLVLARTIFEKLQRESDEGKPRNQILKQQGASDAEQPAAVFGDGFRINCAKCSKLRRDPPPTAPKRPAKACTKKERYWFCESCVTASPEAFAGRGIGVCRPDGKWKMATVRGYEPLSGKHEVVYRSDLPWEFLSLGDPRNHVRYCEPVPPASLGSEPQRPKHKHKHRHQHERQEERGRMNGVEGKPRSPSSLSDPPGLVPGKVKGREDQDAQRGRAGGDGDSGGGGGGGSQDSSARDPGVDDGGVIVGVAVGRANGGVERRGGSETSDVFSGGSADGPGREDGRMAPVGSCQTAAAAAEARAGEASDTAADGSGINGPGKRKRSSDDDSGGGGGGGGGGGEYEEEAEAAAKRKRGDGGGSGIGMADGQALSMPGTVSATTGYGSGGSKGTISANAGDGAPREFLARDHIQQQQQQQRWPQQQYARPEAAGVPNPFLGEYCTQEPSEGEREATEPTAVDG